MRIRFWGVRGSIPAPLTSDEIKDKLISVLEGAKDVDLENRRAIKEYVCSLPPLVRGTVGGNTPCVSIQLGDEWLIIDAGSGIRNLGIELMKREFGQGQGTAHILISHTHWDHIQGFPFFRPLFVPGNRIFIYSRATLPESTDPRLFPQDDPRVSARRSVFCPAPKRRPNHNSRHPGQHDLAGAPRELLWLSTGWRGSQYCLWLGC